MFPTLDNHLGFSPINFFEYFSCSSPPRFFMRMSLSFSADLAKHFYFPVFHILIHKLESYVHIFGMTFGSKITNQKISPAVSILTMTGSLTKMIVLHNNQSTNITSFIAFKSATHSASELEGVILLFPSISKIQVHLT